VVARLAPTDPAVRRASAVLEGAAGALGAAAVEDDADERTRAVESFWQSTSGRGKNMKSKGSKLHTWKWAFAAFTACGICASVLLYEAAAQSKQSAPSGKAFATPQEAAQALIDAAETYNVPELLDILGPDARDLVASEDSVGNKSRSVTFAKLARERESVAVNPENINLATLSVGNEDWPFPIPIVNRKGRWYFDTNAGRQDILFRRIGENELDVITICRGFVEAQQEYASEKHDGSLLNQYAQRMISTPGKHDGLAWQNADGTWGGPVGEAVARALAQGYAPNLPPFHGYYFKVLKGQGPHAPQGQISFMVEGAMIGGFALAAAPAQYRVTGVETFIVGYQGLVYQKDLGPDTLKIFQNMELYDPDNTWHLTNDKQTSTPDVIPELTGTR
jgi:Protein of unknown function (DUF2950)